MLEPDDPTTTSTPDLPANDAADSPPAKAAKKPAKKAAAKKAPAKKAAKKSAADAPADKAGAAEPAQDGPTTKAPAKKAPAKKATKAAGKKVAKQAGEPATADPTPAEAGTAEPATAATAPPALSLPGVLFMAPADEPRKRPAKKAGAKQAVARKAAAKQQPDAEPAQAADAPAKKTARKKASGTQGAANQGAANQADEPVPGDVDLTAAEDAADLTAEPEDVREAAIEQASGARRRRRRGRRGRGGAAKTADGAAEVETEAPSGDDAGPAADDAGEAGTHRRRKRRRAGDDDNPDEETPNTVTHVREPKAPDDGVKGVKGSTRLEAKRQRRRDGRETTRRRAPILSEAEFLARRESVDRVMAVRQAGDRTQIAVLEDDVLVEHYVTRASATSYVGNVYLGRVQNVLPSMEAAFVDIGKGRNGVLYAGEVNWDAAGLEGKSRAIENALNSGDAVLVQVTKDPIGHKGARLTSQVSLPGRFLVYVPGGGMTGISRRLPDTERHRLKTILKKIVPEDAGVIVRTAAEGASEEDLARDVERLKAEWESIEGAAKDTKSAPRLVHGEPDLATRVVRDVFNEDFKSLIVQGEQAWQTVSDYVSSVAPDLAERVSRHGKDTDLFADLRVDEQLMKALDRKVWLPSGGSLVIDRTEAMTVIDVNTGKFVGAGGNLEQTVTRNNLEAAEEIVRQLRLRDVGGIVVVDFIDMVLESNRELVLRRLTECLARDRTKHQVAEVTSLGLVQMTRKRVGEGLLEAFSETCEVCKGRGVIIHAEPVDKQGTPHDEDERPAGKSRRKRGGRGNAPTEPVEPLPAASDEQRKAANAAIAAIHRAAAADEKDGEGGAPNLIDVLASDLVQAVASPDGSDRVSSDGSAGVASDEPAGASSDEPAGASPDESAGVSSDGSADASSDESAGAAAAELPAPDVENEPAPHAASEAANGSARTTAETDQAPARRRRRVASRPAGPPGAA